MEGRRRFTAWPQFVFGKTFGTFGVTALLLALSGVYGVMAYSVTRRRREIGLRIALGAAPRDVFRLVMGRAVGLTALGVLIGAAGALAVTRLLTGIIFGVSPSDPTTFIVTSLLLAAAALLASYLPARSTIKSDGLGILSFDRL
jgi:ABC-type antimicrobial peptide transport system permease subunit